jgi:hypothetical protein
MLGLAGVTARDVSTALVTVSVVEPEVLPDVAVIVVLPTVFPYAYACPTPFNCDAVVLVDVVVLLVVATFVSDEIQVTDAVRSLVVLFE